MVKSTVNGYEVECKDGVWIYVDSREPVIDNPDRQCACCDGKTINVKVKIPADLSSTGMEKWRYCKIDACIASIIEALQDAGIDMRGSCCGHGKGEGDIHLQNGRTILILDKETADIYWKRKTKDRDVTKAIKDWL